MRIIQLSMLLGFILLLFACNKEDIEVSVEVKSYEMSTIITTAGYNMESLTYGKVFDYHRQEIYNKYDLDPDIYDLFEGVDDNGQTVYLIAFSTTEEAISYEDALTNDPDEDRIIYREDQVVLLTYSQAIIDLYD